MVVALLDPVGMGDRMGTHAYPQKGWGALKGPPPLRARQVSALYYLYIA